MATSIWRVSRFAQSWTNVFCTTSLACAVSPVMFAATLTSEGKFVVVDYVNEVCDMRLQSNHIDGVPDSIVRRVAQLIVHEVEKHSSSMRKI